MSDKIVSLAPAADVLRVPDMLEMVVEELRQQGGKGSPPKAVLVIARNHGEMTDTQVHFAGGVIGVAEGVGLLELGKMQVLLVDG